MLKQTSQKHRKMHKNERGMATLETLPLLFIFIMLVTYMLGFFGAIHSAILGSISARSYAFETFRNRTNLMYFRDDAGAGSKQYKDMQVRIHASTAEKREESDQLMRSTERPIRVGMTVEPGPSRNDASVHNTKIFDSAKISQGKRNTTVEVSPIWVMVQYGICVSSACGDTN